MRVSGAAAIQRPIFVRFSSVGTMDR